VTRPSAGARLGDDAALASLSAAAGLPQHPRGWLAVVAADDAGPTATVLQQAAFDAGLAVAVAPVLGAVTAVVAVPAPGPGGGPDPVVSNRLCRRRATGRRGARRRPHRGPEGRAARTVDDVRSRGADLLLTLETYLAHGRSATAAARALSLQRQSLYQRIERIRALVGPDLDDPRAALDLALAVRAQRLSMHARAPLDQAPTGGVGPVTEGRGR
jgi:hypothetical protein